MGRFPTVSSPAMMSLDYKPFHKSGPPTKLKEATFVPMIFCFIDVRVGKLFFILAYQDGKAQNGSMLGLALGCLRNTLLVYSL